MVQQHQYFAELGIGSGKMCAFIFEVAEHQTDFKITIKSNTSKQEHDLNYLLCSYQDYEIYRNWRANRSELKRDEVGNAVTTSFGVPILIPTPFPNIHLCLNLLTNQIEKTFPLDIGSYVLVLDNKHSTVTSKSVWLDVVESWDHDVSLSNLPLIDQLSNKLPTDVLTCVMDANNSYKSGHYNQCSIMLRKAIEIACKIKLLQSNVPHEQLVDGEGYEITLRKKIKLLQTKNLITQKNLKDIEHVKWFGDQSVHSSMKIAFDDIKDTIEPRSRNFLVGLNLKS